MINLSSFIRFHALQTPTKTAIVFGDSRISFSEFHEKILATAGLMADAGIRAGDVVALWMKNSPAFLDVAFAASHIGAVFLPVNFRLSLDELRYILADSGAKMLFMEEDAARDEDFGLTTIMLNGPMCSDIRIATGTRTAPAAAFRNMGDLLRLMYTSGTTDRPKGVMHTYENFYVKCAEHVVVFGLTANDKLLVAGPLYHVGAFDLPGIAVLWLGGLMCILRDADAAAILVSIERERLTCGALVPFLTGTLLSHAERHQYDVSSVRWIVGGGERTPAYRVRDFHAYFTNARYIDCYGLTETCSGDAMMVPGYELSKIGSVGRATPHVEIEIRDDVGKLLPPKEQGEICVRGPKVTPGYWNDPVKTAASFYGDWLRTGDIGYFDEDGFLFLTDRKKDIIISGGENIASSEVERVIYELPAIQEAVVIGLPDPKWGERPIAVVILKPGQTIDFPTLVNHCRRHLAAFKVPKELLVVTEFPRTPSNKILKRQLRAELTASPNRSVAVAPLDNAGKS